MVAVCLLSIATYGVVGANIAHTSNDNWGFNFTIQPHQANSRRGARYRQTTNVNNKWKVNMQSSGEGARTGHYLLVRKCGWDQCITIAKRKARQWLVLFSSIFKRVEEERVSNCAE